MAGGAATVLAALGDRIGPAQRNVLEAADTGPGGYARAAFASGELVTVARKALAAADAVLRLADELTGDAAPSSAYEEDRAWVRAECAARFRAAVLAALTGKEEDGG